MNCHHSQKYNAFSSLFLAMKEHYVKMSTHAGTQVINSTHGSSLWGFGPLASTKKKNKNTKKDTCSCDVDKVPVLPVVRWTTDEQPTITDDTLKCSFFFNYSPRPLLSEGSGVILCWWD